MTAQSRGIRRVVVAALIFIVVVVSGFVWRINQPVLMSDSALQANGAIEFDKPRIFSDFQLTDHRGQLFSKDNLKGTWSIVFFGFTHCPDVCPTTLSTLRETYDKLRDRERDKLQIIMVTLDAQRDTVEKMAEYVPYFHREFIGVSGNQHQIRRWAGEVNIAYDKVALGEDNYTIDHSTQLVLINPRGDYHGFFKAPHQQTMLRKTWRSIDATFNGW